MPQMPELIADAQACEEQFLRQIFVRDQMAEWSQAAAASWPRPMACTTGTSTGKRYLDALSGIYVVSVGHNNRRVIEAIHHAARYAALLAADARDQSGRGAVGESVWREAGDRAI